MNEKIKSKINDKKIVRRRLTQRGIPTCYGYHEKENNECIHCYCESDCEAGAS